MNNTNWVYEQTEPALWTVGFYDPDGRWHGDSDHSDRESAAKRVHYLNGGVEPKEETECDRKECDYYSHYLIHYNPEVNGVRLEHEAYHFAIQRCGEAQERISNWMNENEIDPLEDSHGKFLWQQAEKWERRVAA